MTFKEIEALAQSHETGNLEFKRTTGQLDAGMETLCAFLNVDGGTVLFGVCDDGSVKGQDVGDDTKRNIAEAIARFEPRPIVGIQYVDVPDSGGKKVIVIHCDSQSRPFAFKGRAFRRIESVTSIMSQEYYRYLFFSKIDDKYSWDRMLNPELKLTDLDENYFWGAIRAGISSGRLPEVTIKESMEEILEKLELMRDGLLTNAAAVLFGKQRIGYLQCCVRLARFRGTNKNEFIDNQQASGNIFKLLDDSMAFFFKHLPLSAKIEGLYREEELFIPRKALRECCINAFCHRRYDIAGSSVGIAIYDDRIEVESFGTLPDPLNVDDLFIAHNSVPRNRLIAETLYKTDLIESWGRGIDLIRSECARVGQPEPEFSNERLFFVTYFRYNRPLTTIITEQVSEQVGAQGAHDGVQVLQPTAQVLAFLRVFEKIEAATTKEAMALLSLRRRQTFLHSYLTPALKAGWVSRKIPELPKSPNQRYYITQRGREILASIEKED